MLMTMWTEITGDTTISLLADDPPDVHTNVNMVTSADGGNTWTDPVQIFEDTSQVMDLTGAVGMNGQPGLLYYDFRNDVSPDDSEITTDAWFREPCGGQGAWCETHLAGPFDANTMPSDAIAEENLGDYEGVAGMPGGFAVAFTVAEAGTTGPSVIVFGTI
jgi:hypothetical protein